MVLKGHDPDVKVADRPASVSRLAIAGVVAIGAVYLATRLLLIWRFPPFWDEGQYAGWAHLGFVDSHFRFISLANGSDPSM